MCHKVWFITLYPTVTYQKFIIIKLKYVVIDSGGCGLSDANLIMIYMCISDKIILLLDLNFRCGNLVWFLKIPQNECMHTASAAIHIYAAIEPHPLF